MLVSVTRLGPNFKKGTERGFIPNTCFLWILIFSKIQEHDRYVIWSDTSVLFKFLSPQDTEIKFSVSLLEDQPRNCVVRQTFGGLTLLFQQ